jgi:hypothetical protein
MIQTVRRVDVNKKLALIVYLIHSPIVIWDALRDHGAVEQWKFFFSFILDFPASIAFHYFIDIIYSVMSLLGTSIDKSDIATMGVFVCHLILGGLWWILIVSLLLKLINRAGHK